MVDPIPGKSCGSCTACCKMLRVVELQKPGGVYCSHCTIGAGCGIYPERPDSCRTFMCAWLYSPAMGRELKPEVTHVVIWEYSDRHTIFADCDPDRPEAWRAPAVINFLRQTAAKLPDWLVVAKVGQRTWRVTKDAILSEEGDVTGFVELRVAPVWRAAFSR